MFERFTKNARAVVVRARRESEALHHSRIGTEHLLLGLLEGEGVAATVLWDTGLDAATVHAQIAELVGPKGEYLGDADAEALRAIGIDLDAVRSSVEESFGAAALRPPQDPPSGLLRRLLGESRGMSPRAKKVLELSLREALNLKHNYIGTEHILLGLLREENGLAARILTRTGHDLAELRRLTLAAMAAKAV